MKESFSVNVSIIECIGFLFNSNDAIVASTGLSLEEIETL